MQHTIRRLLKWLGYTALGCYVILAVAFIGVRYWLLPNIDRWREPLQQELSVMLETPVQLGQIAADWRGTHLRILIKDAELRDLDGRSLLEIPSFHAELAWPALLLGRLDFRSLHANEVALTIRRDTDNRIHVLGQAAEDNAQDGPNEQNTGAATLDWLARQGDVRISNARVRWIDERRAAPPLHLHDVSLFLGTRGEQRRFSMLARPPQSLGQSFLLQAHVQLDDETPAEFALHELSGLFHLNIANMQPAAWQPWLELHAIVEQGEVSWAAWQHVEQGTLTHHVSQAEIHDGHWKIADTRLQAAKAFLHVEGPWSALRHIGTWKLDASADAVRAGPVRIATQLHGLKVDAPTVFEQALVADELAWAGAVDLDPAVGLRVTLDTAQLRNADMDLELQGDWQQRGGGKGGVADISGRFLRAELSAIARYLPHIVDGNAKAWLRQGLLAGRLIHAPLLLKGDLVHFPFGENPDRGEFFLGGPVRGAIIDYAPADEPDEPGWPRIDALDGHAELHKVDLRIRADTMEMWPAEGTRIELGNVLARIPDIENDAVLSVEGTGTGEGEAFLALIRGSPLNELLDGRFNAAQGQGLWEVPVSLTIPLTAVQDTQVAGSVVFRDGSLQFDSSLPALTALHGRIDFTEAAMSAHDLKGTALGGPVTISGSLGKEGEALTLAGRLAAKALYPYLGEPIQGLVTGTTAYQLGIRRDANGNFGLQLEAPLEGLALNLPTPLDKPAKARKLLKVDWDPAKKDGNSALNIQLGDLHARLLHHSDNKKRKAPFFHSGAISLNGKAALADSGMVVDMALPRIDIDAWRELWNDIASGSDQSVGLFPALRDLRLQAETAHAFGVDLDQLTFTARRPEGDRWRVDVSSTQTAGTLFWQARQGRIQGRVDAHFERLAIGTDNEAEASGGDSPTASEPDDELHIPAIQLKVDRLRLYGRDVGSVFLEGVNDVPGRNWKLSQLQVQSPHAVLQGSGVWQLDGARRGLTIQATAMFDDMGAYLAQLGYGDLMEGGHGEIQGNIEWRGIPTRFDRAELYGDLDVNLAKGRLVNLGSRSGRLLELLSLQSVQRLARLDWNPAGLMKQGFPFDTVLGNLQLDGGVLHSKNYRVTSPVATIVMAGDVDLVDEVVDLHAVVIPSLDVSGAAIAAGIAVNPIVGVGAFLTQWLLKHPLSKAMTVEYRVKGSFDDPQLMEIETVDKKKNQTAEEK